MKPNEKADLVICGLAMLVCNGAAYCYAMGKKYQREQDKAPVDTTPSGDSTVEDTDTPTGPTE